MTFYTYKSSDSVVGKCGCFVCNYSYGPTLSGFSSSRSSSKRVGFAVQLEDVIPDVTNGDIYCYWFGKWSASPNRLYEALVWRAYYRVLNKGWYESF